MTGDFGKFINEKRLGRASDGSDILLKDIAQAMGTTATLSLIHISEPTRH